MLGSLALTVSTHLECPALAVLNHDDDVLWYQLFNSGKLLDAYISASDWWEDSSGPAPQGNPEILCRFMGVPGDQSRVKKILGRSTGVLGYLSPLAVIKICWRLWASRLLLRVLALRTLARGSSLTVLVQTKFFSFEGMGLWQGEFSVPDGLRRHCGLRRIGQLARRFNHLLR